MEVRRYLQPAYHKGPFFEKKNQSVLAKLYFHSVL